MVRIDEQTRSLFHTNESQFVKTIEPFEEAAEFMEIDCPSEESTSEASEMDGPSGLDRTESQVQKQRRVQDVLRHLGDHHEPVRQLKKTVLHLVDIIGQEGACLEDARKILQESRKRARNRGEDLLDDTLALDKLTGLFAEDRANRKAAIAALDALLEEVDTVKSDLTRIEKDLNARLEAQQHQTHQREPWTRNHASDDDAMAEHMEPTFAEEPRRSDAAEPINTDILGQELTDHKIPGLTKHPELAGPGDVVMEDDGQSEESPGNPGCFRRTESQSLKQSKMHDVLGRLKDHRDALRRLRENAARFVWRIAQDESCLDDDRKVINDCRKIARNCGEDAIEDMVALGNLSGMFPEDQAIKKKAIASLDALLEELDAVKSNLAEADKDVIAKLEIKAPIASDQVAALANTADHQVLRLRGSGPSKGIEEVQAQVHAAQERIPEVPVPVRKFWKQLELPLQFKSSEEGSCYTLSCRAPGLHAQEVKLELSRDSGHLIISAAHLPAAAEVEDMQKTIEQHCLKLGRRSLDPQAALELYARLGGGTFGSFSQKFQLPRDVDVTRIEASCDQGFLRVKLPKHIRRARPVQSPLLGGRSFCR